MLHEDIERYAGNRLFYCEPNCLTVGKGTGLHVELFYGGTYYLACQCEPAFWSSFKSCTLRVLCGDFRLKLFPIIY